VPYKHIIENVISKVKKFKGVHQVLVLEEDDKKRVLELERQAEQRVIMGLGQGDSQGVKTALKRDVVISIITDNEYEWPPGPNVILMQEGEVIGEEMTDEGLKKLKKRKDVIITGNFVIYKDKISKSSLINRAPPLVIFPPKGYPQIEEMPHVKDAIVGSPSLPTDIYLRSRMCVKSEEALGTVLVGFNILVISPGVEDDDRS